MNENVILSDEELRSLTQAILTRHGIDFTCYEPLSLKRRIARAISVLELENLHHLWLKILKEPGFIHVFMNEISVGLTSMFRDPVLWKTLKNKLGDAYAKKDEIKIWHTGCSTGEEVYTMAILMKEINMLNRANALATDISQRSIETAKKGEYHVLKLNEYEKNYTEYNPSHSLMHYYKADESNAQFDTTLTRHVDFKYHNLISDNFQGQYDIIFCRNVMIYFDNDAKTKLMQKFHEVLKPGGLFIIGFFDAMLPLVDEQLFTVDDLNAKILTAR